MTATPFTVLNHISKTFEPPSEEDAEAYNIFMANNYFANYPDTIMLANIANTFHKSVPPSHHIMFYSNTVQKGKRGHFWPKKAAKDKCGRIENIMKWFATGRERAIELEEFIPNALYAKLHARENPKTKTEKVKQK